MTEDGYEVALRTGMWVYGGRRRDGEVISVALFESCCGWCRFTTRFRN